MVAQQLQPRGIDDPRVLSAMSCVPRERFLPAALAAYAYEDQALGIDCGQTISQPYIVALMTQAAELQGTEHVLEIGTGSGYQAAILGLLARSVVSIERIAKLAVQARRRLAALKVPNVEVRVGDGTLGCPERAPFDVILVTAAGPHIPPALFEQLREGGRLIMPVGGPSHQVMEVVVKTAGQPEVRSLSGCRFVKLIGAQGWQPSPDDHCPEPETD